jgi:hypothetical protein
MVRAARASFPADPWATARRRADRHPARGLLRLLVGAALGNGYVVRIPVDQREHRETWNGDQRKMMFFAAAGRSTMAAALCAPAAFLNGDEEFRRCRNFKL